MQDTSPRYSPAVLAAIFYTGFTSSGLLIAKPLIVGALIDHYGFSAQQSGFVAGIEMVGIGFAAFVVGLFGPAWRRRAIVRTGAVLGVLGSAVPLLHDHFLAVLALRFVAGIGCGLIAGVVVATIGTMRDPDRTFGIYFLCNYLVSALLFPLLAVVVGHAGADGGYLILAALLLSAFAAARAFPDAPLQPATKLDGQRLPFPLRGALLSVAVSVAFWIGLGAFVAFSERLAIDRGLSAAEIAGVLASAQVASIAGALTASVLHTRLGRAIPSLCSVGFALMGFVLLTQTQGLVGYSLAVTFIYFAWPLFLAYLNGTMSMLDGAGRVVALSVTSQTVGMAIGPAIAGVLVARDGYNAVASLGLLASMAAMALLVPLMVATRGVSADVPFRPVITK